MLLCSKFKSRRQCKLKFFSDKKIPLINQTILPNKLQIHQKDLRVYFQDNEPKLYPYKTFQEVKHANCLLQEIIFIGISNKIEPYWVYHILKN